MSQHVWFKGPKCGVDNCRTRLWRLVDGRHVCRYGHVKEGDLEIGEDEDDFFSSQGRKLVIPSQEQAQKRTQDDDGPKVLYGSEGNALFMQCFQYLLRAQLAWLVGEQGIPRDLEPIVRSLWAIYVDETAFAKTEYHESDNSSQARDDSLFSSHSSSSRLDDNGIEGDTKGGVGSDSIDRLDDTEAGVDDNTASRYMILGADDGDIGDIDASPLERSSSPRPKAEVELITSIALCYLGCVLLRIPVYIYDFNRWVYRCEFPYMQAMRILPREMRTRLAQYYGHVFTPKGPPSADKLHAAVQKTAAIFDRRNITFPCPQWTPLILKFVQDLLLPPEVALAAENILLVLDLKPALAVSGRMQRRGWPEPLIAATVVVAAKLYCGLSEYETNYGALSPNVGDTPENVTVKQDWEVWADMLRKLWIEDESPAEADERDVSWWDSGRIDRYLAWFQKNLITDDMNQQDPSRQRLLNMFPLSENNSISEQLNAVPATVAEVLRLLQSTSTIAQHIEAPGAQYLRFRKLESPSSLISILYETTAKLAGLRVDTLCQRVFALESKMISAKNLQ